MEFLIKISKHIIIYRSIIISLYLLSVFNIQNTFKKAEIVRNAHIGGIQQLLMYVDSGIKQFGITGFIFSDRYIFYKLLTKLFSNDQLLNFCIIFSAIGWILLSVAYARFIRNRVIKELFIIFVLIFSLSYTIQFWNYIIIPQNISNITNLYVIISIPLLLTIGKRYFAFLGLTVFLILISIFTRQPNIFYFLSLVTLFLFMILVKKYRIINSFHLSFSMILVILVILIVNINTPPQNFNYSFDMILCRRIINPFDSYSLSIFKGFKKKYRDKNIEYFDEKYGIDYISLNQNKIEKCDSLEFLSIYKKKYPERMEGNSAHFFKGCCWLITNHNLQDWIHKNSKRIYFNYLLDNFLYESFLFFIDTGGFVYAKSYGMDKFQQENPFNRMIGKILFSWTQPLMKFAVDVDSKEPSNIRTKSYINLSLILPLPYVIFSLLIFLIFIRNNIMVEARLSTLFLICSIAYSLVIVYLGSPGLSFQRHFYWTNVLFNFTIYFMFFVIVDSIVLKKLKHNNQ